MVVTFYSCHLCHKLESFFCFNFLFTCFHLSKSSSITVYLLITAKIDFLWPKKQSCWLKKKKSCFKRFKKAQYEPIVHAKIVLLGIHLNKTVSSVRPTVGVEGYKMLWSADSPSLSPLVGCQFSHFLWSQWSEISVRKAEATSCHKIEAQIGLFLQTESHGHTEDRCVCAVPISGACFLFW